MNDIPTSLGLIVMTAIAAAAVFSAIRRLGVTDEAKRAAMAHRVAAMLWVCAAGCAGLFVYRWVAVNGNWQPLEAHVDGLLLLSSLVSLISLFLQDRSRVPGFGLFALPALAILMAWGICASIWSFRPFAIQSVWTAVHLMGVYMGSLALVVSAGMGAMFLVVDSRLRHKNDPTSLSRFGKLETIERLMAQTAALAFALVTLGVVTGLILAVNNNKPVESMPIYVVKIALAAGSWLSVFLVMQSRHMSSLRGYRAAVLSLIALLLLALSLAAALTPAGHRRPAADSQPSSLGSTDPHTQLTPGTEAMRCV